MGFTYFLNHKKSGFLLMEALLALLLLTSFSVVIGMYWQHLCHHQKNAEMKLQAISIATEVIDGALFGKKNFEYGATDKEKFTITTSKNILAKPRIIKGILENLENPYLAQVTVSWKLGTPLQISIPTIIGESI